MADGALELYHPLWEDAAEGDELIPTRGCFVPTFHGSAADLAAVAATLVNMIGLHLQQAEAAVSGTHLIALPHAPGAMHDYWFGEALGELRTGVGMQIAVIAAAHGLDIEDDLAQDLPKPDEG